MMYIVVQMDEGNEEYIPCDSPLDATSYVRSHLIDADDDEDVRIHAAALNDDADLLQKLLQEKDFDKWLDHRVKPFNASPLRLAVTVGSIACVSLLLEKGAKIDKEDIKGQTPLFVATSTRNLPVMEILLKNGANPEGSTMNRGTPLIIAVRDGFADGVKLLLHYGANCEPFSILATCVPGWPLQHSVVYGHFSCFLELLRGGARPNLDGPFAVLAPSVINRLSVVHAILKYCREKPEFVRLYFDCGGDLSKVHEADPICQDSCPAVKALLRLQKTPRALKSIARIAVLHTINFDEVRVDALDVPSSLRSYLKFDEYKISAQRTVENLHTKIYEADNE